MYDLYSQLTSVPARSVGQSSSGATRSRVRLPLALKLLLLFSCFLEFRFYCNMRLIQFNVYCNYHFHIFMLTYITRFSHLHKCEQLTTYSHLYIGLSASDISFFIKRKNEDKEMQSTSRHDIKFYTALLVGINTGSGSNSIAIALQQTHCTVAKSVAFLHP